MALSASAAQTAQAATTSSLTAAPPERPPARKQRRRHLRRVEQSRGRSKFRVRPFERSGAEQSTDERWSGYRNGSWPSD